MAVIEGGVSGALAEVDANLAQRVSIRPLVTLGWNSIGAQSGALTGIAAAAPIFSFRNISANLILVRRVGIGFMTTTAFTAAQALDFSLRFARAFTVSDSAGTAIAQTGNENKHRTSLGTPTSLDVRISAAAALTAGTRTLDAVAHGIAAGGSAGLATGLIPGQDNLFQHSSGDYPLVLAQNEGFIIQNNTLMGAAGVVKAYVNMEYAEIATY